MDVGLELDFRKWKSEGGENVLLKLNYLLFFISLVLFFLSFYYLLIVILFYWLFREVFDG